MKVPRTPKQKVIAVTDCQKNMIIVLRENGCSYSIVAEETGLNRDTVKSFCRRHDLGGRRSGHGKDFPPGVCPQCGAQIGRQAKTKPRRFCCDSCRRAWWSKHPDKGKKKAVYAFSCANCGVRFTAFGNSKRKYCCHSCYIAARFGGGRG